jgi:hypothetical protein
LAGRTPQDGEVLGQRGGRKGIEQAGLADARLAGQQHDAEVASVHLREAASEQRQLLGAADQGAMPEAQQGRRSVVWSYGHEGCSGMQGIQFKL